MRSYSPKPALASWPLQLVLRLALIVVNASFRNLNETKLASVVIAQALIRLGNR